MRVWAVSVRYSVTVASTASKISRTATAKRSIKYEFNISNLDMMCKLQNNPAPIQRIDAEAVLRAIAVALLYFDFRWRFPNWHHVHFIVHLKGDIVISEIV